MTKDELTDRLPYLDPGANLTMDEAVLAEVFGADTLNQKAAEAIEAFALEHRCTFLHDPTPAGRPAIVRITTGRHPAYSPVETVLKRR